MKFWFCIGTAAELIKMYPIIDEAENRKIDWFLISTGQSGINLWKQYKDFQLPENRVIRLQNTDRDLSNSKMALKWFFSSFFKSKKSLINTIKKQGLVSPNTGDYWFVHGDTLSSLLGSIYGKRLKLPIVHVEAGMRSHHIFSPFPEEINRRIVSRLACYHMAPDDNAAKNLTNEGIIKNVVVTNGNSVMDTLAVAVKRFKIPEDMPATRFALVNIHRFENLSSSYRWQKIIEIIIKTSKDIQVLFVLMPNTEMKLANEPETKNKLINANVQLLNRLPFSKFVHLMNSAEFMVTDGGSNQQECFHLGKPCLILRENTESIEGIGTCCVLSEFNEDKINDFLDNPQKYKRDRSQNVDRATDIIFKNLSL